VENLVKTYQSGTEKLHILRGLSFTVPRGTSAAVRGSSGCGKSTLLNIIGGLDRSDSGLVEAAGLDISNLSEKDLTEYRKRKLGFVFQFHYLLRDFTALENVMIPGYIAGLKKKAALQKAAALLEDLGLAARSHHYPPELSGGERQRVAAARSLINDPLLILADEPTGNLDPENSLAVARMLFRAAEKWNAALVVVTHDDQVARQARLQFELSAGVLAEVSAGSPGEVTGEAGGGNPGRVPGGGNLRG
jgi:lipoprotein-releasing system ATP-binding protein